MREAFEHDEERLARLIAGLPPAPEAWVEAAADLPRTRREADRIVALAEADQRFRAAALADLESALRHAGYDPSPALVAVLRDRIGAVDGG
jgi:hypothetical protein